MVSVRCRVYGKELEGHATKTKSCGCRNMTTVRGENVSANDLSQVVMLNSGKVMEKSSLTPQDLQWQEERKKRKVRKLDFEVR
jgi:hypothetical protein